ncbi:g7714 [Coccomyxa viridis]|uniref:G7714 protein n=1 Tax=Coccomyxa viridis TaxID=1274662 RepID=A0ABP1FYJ0_9CHLO
MADYAPPGYFAQHPLVQGFQLRDKFIGLDMDQAKDVLVRAYQYESDTHGQVVKDGLSIHIQPTGFTVDETASVRMQNGSEASNTSLSPVPAAFDNFHGVTIESMIWLDSTATIRNQQHFDDVAQRKYYVDMFRLQAPSMRGRFVVMNWILSERITAAAAPLYQGLPIGNLTGYTVNIRVQAGNLTPVTALVQNMIITALFEPFEALCSAANGEMVEVVEETTTSALFSIAMVVVYDECVISEAMPKALQNHTFTSFLQQYGLDFQSAEYVSAEYRPGLSVLQQAAAFGYPSTVYEIRPKVPLCVPAWAWIIIAVAALALLVAGLGLLCHLYLHQREVSKQWDSIKLCKNPDGSTFLLGQGNYGMVYKGILNKRTSVAVKTFSRRGTDLEVIRFNAEVQIMQTLADIPELVRCYPYTPQPRPQSRSGLQICQLVMELMEGGDLHDALHIGEKRIEWKAGGCRLAAQIALGLSKLHQRKVVHCDLKAKNILLNKDRTSAKIGDVGLARIMAETHLSTASGCFGTFAYTAPEVLGRRRCDEKIDIFSLGVLMREMVTGEIPQPYQMREQLALLVPGIDCQSDVASLIQECCHNDPQQRPSAEHVHDRLTVCLDKDSAFLSSAGGKKLTQLPQPAQVPSVVNKDVQRGPNPFESMLGKSFGDGSVNV